MAITLRTNSAKVTHTKPGVEASFDLTTDGDVQAGDHVYVFLFTWQGPTANGALIASVSDDQGGVWAEIDRRRITAAAHTVALWRGTGMTGGAPLTATMTYDDAGPAGLFSAAIVSAGGMSAAAVNVTDTNENGNGTTITTATIATTVADTLAFGLGYAVDNGTGTISTPTGWSLLEESEAPEAFSVAYQILSATNGSLNATWNTSNTMVTPISIISAFEAAGGGGGHAPIAMHLNRRRRGH